MQAIDSATITLKVKFTDGSNTTMSQKVCELDLADGSSFSTVSGDAFNELLARFMRASEEV